MGLRRVVTKYKSFVFSSSKSFALRGIGRLSYVLYRKALSAMNATGTHLCDLVNSRLTHGGAESCRCDAVAENGTTSS